MGDAARFCPHCGGQRPEDAAAPSASQPLQPTVARPEVTPSPKPRRARNHRRRNWIALGAVILVIIIAVSSNNSSKTPTTTTNATKSTTKSAVSSAPHASAAEQYIRKHGADANRVQANVLLVSLAVTQAKKSGDLNAVAQAAQSAHDNLDNIRNDFADTASIACSSCSLGDASLELFTASNDLKNAMGALVAYTGDPNPATLAHFNTQFATARSEWNQGARFIWAGKANKPTL